SLNLENLNRWRGMLQSREVTVYFPRFKMERKYAMVDDLMKMGMKSAFDPAKADLSGLTGKRDLYVTSVYHQAYVEVNEEGTEAAGATGIVVGRTAVEKRIIFRADHPFIFLIQDRKTGNILFIGRVHNPQK
ncbi:MAG: serpin family protein, partial [bacterium]